MLWLVLLFLLRIFFDDISVYSGASVIIDLSVFGAVTYLLRTNKVSRALMSWQFLRQRRYKKIQRQFTLAIVSDLLRFFSLPFIFLWFTRWFEAWPNLMAHVPSSHYLNYLDVFIFSLGFSVVLDADWIIRFLSKARLTTGRQVLFHYLATIFIGTFLLLLPISVKDGQELYLIDALFLSVSALSVTGLAPIDIGSTLSLIGQTIILVLIQLGGLGIVLITAGFSVATMNRLSLNSILLGREMYGECRVGEVPQFMARVVGLTIAIEAFGALALYLSFPPGMPNPWFNAIFHSVSAFCNAGFGLYPESLGHQVFGGVGIATVCALIVIGGMGFPILLDLGSLLKNRNVRRSMNPHMQLTLITMLFFLISGTILFFFFEYLRPTANLGMVDIAKQSIFYSISSRTAGFGMIPIESFHLSALFCIILLMIVGANPSSTGGGVKTTTIGVIIVSVWHTIRGRKQIVFSGRAIPDQTLARAITVVTLYLLFSGVAFVILVMSEDISPFALGFEVISALSTVGLSMSVTPHLSIFGKVIIMFLMLFGRIGILSIVLMGLGSSSPSKLKYPESDFFVG